MGPCRPRRALTPVSPSPVSERLAHGAKRRARSSAESSSLRSRLPCYVAELRWPNSAVRARFREGTRMRIMTPMHGAFLFSGWLFTFAPLVGAQAQDVDVPGNLTMHDSTDPTVGNIFNEGVPFLHNFGLRNTFLGINAGNLTLTGFSNTATGASALTANSSLRGRTSKRSRRPGAGSRIRRGAARFTCAPSNIAFQKRSG